MGIDVDNCLKATGAHAVMSAEGILSNPLLFKNQNSHSFEIAADYIKYAEKYQASVSAIRAHIFRICHYR